MTWRYTTSRAVCLPSLSMLRKAEPSPQKSSRLCSPRAWPIGKPSCRAVRSHRKSAPPSEERERRSRMAGRPDLAGKDVVLHAEPKRNGLDRMCTSWRHRPGGLDLRSIFNFCPENGIAFIDWNGPWRGACIRIYREAFAAELRNTRANINNPTQLKAAGFLTFSVAALSRSVWVWHFAGPGGVYLTDGDLTLLQKIEAIRQAKV